MAIKISAELKPEEAFYDILDLSSERVAQLLAYLYEEHRQSRMAHDDYFNELKILRRAIKPQPATRIKTFPWVGASNFVAPLIRIAGDAVKARIVNTLTGPKPFWLCSTKPGSPFAEFALPWQRFLEWAVVNDLNLDDAIERIADQVVYLGKCPVKIHWFHEVRKIRTYDQRIKKEVNKVVVYHDQPRLTPILLENWLEPWGLEDSLEKPWVSHRVFLRVGDLVEREKLELIKNVDKVKETYLNHIPQDIIDLGELSKQSWVEAQAVELYETCVRYDIDNDGFREECLVLWHYESQTPLSVRYNFFWHGRRPLEMLFYLRHGHSNSTADGLAHLLWPIQEATSSFINQRTDNITIANTRFFKARKGVGLAKGEQIWPGKIFLLDDPEKDLVPEKLGDVSPSSFTHETILRDYAERLSGISDPQLGREFDNPRVAATTTLSVLQEGNRRFDMVIKLMRAAFGRIGMQVTQLYQQFKPRIPLDQILSEDDLMYVSQILMMTPEDVEKNLLIQVSTATAGMNKESQRQGLLALYNLLMQFYGQIIQNIAPIMASPQVSDGVKDVIVEMSRAVQTLLQQIIQSYDLNNVEAFLIDVTNALEGLRSGALTPQGVEQSMMAGLQNFGGQINSQAGGATSPLGVATSPSPEGGVAMPDIQAIAQNIS